MTQLLLETNYVTMETKLDVLTTVSQTLDSLVPEKLTKLQFAILMFAEMPSFQLENDAIMATKLDVQLDVSKIKAILVLARSVKCLSVIQHVVME